MRIFVSTISGLKSFAVEVLNLGLNLATKANCERFSSFQWFRNAIIRVNNFVLF